MNKAEYQYTVIMLAVIQGNVVYKSTLYQLINYLLAHLKNWYTDLLKLAKLVHTVLI